MDEAAPNLLILKYFNYKSLFLKDLAEIFAKSLILKYRVIGRGVPNIPSIESETTGRRWQVKDSFPKWEMDRSLSASVAVCDLSNISGVI